MPWLPGVQPWAPSQSEWLLGWMTKMVKHFPAKLLMSLAQNRCVVPGQYSERVPLAQLHGDEPVGPLPLWKKPVLQRGRKLPVWACGVSRWTPSLGDRIIPSIFTFKSPTIYPNCTAISCTILLLNTRLSQSRKLPVFPRVARRVCLLGLHAATSP